MEGSELFKSANDFCLHIEEIARTRRLSYMESVLHYCNENFLEPDDVSPLINSNLKDKISLEMQELNYLPKQAKLDV